MVLYHRLSAMSTVGKAGFTGLHTFAKEMEKSAKDPLTDGFYLRYNTEAVSARATLPSGHDP